MKLVAMNTPKIRICNRCVMDTTAAEIEFDADGVCSFCRQFEVKARRVLRPDHDSRQRKLNQLVQEIRKRGKGKPYDCVVGVSGGVDSSWVLVNAVRMGLRPLAVHVNNGWNSELA